MRQCLLVVFLLIRPVAHLKVCLAIERLVCLRYFPQRSGHCHMPVSVVPQNFMELTLPLFSYLNCTLIVFTTILCTFITFASISRPLSSALASVGQQPCSGHSLRGLFCLPSTARKHLHHLKSLRTGSFPLE